MATLVLTLAGAAAGNALLPAGLTLFGATLSGASIGGTIGSFIGGQIDSSLAGSGGGRHVEGPRLSELPLQTSTEGAPILRVYGRARVGGQIIWAANFKEVQETSTVSSGGGGKGGSRRTAKTTVTEYKYYASFALALCDGPIGGIGRIWADGKPLDVKNLTMRLYRGEEDQDPDALMELIEGEGAVPAYRGLAYLVFEDLPLASFGNRVPQLNVEIFRQVVSTESTSLDRLVRGVDLIPGSGEFVYASEPVARNLGPGETAPENVMNGTGQPNMLVSLDQLEAQLPAVEAVLLVVAWYGNDLRCAHCEIRPGVEIANKSTTVTWSVNGVSRAAAHLVSSDEDGPLLGGTPSDKSVVQAIAELKARGFAVVLYPFLMMDIPPESPLPDPRAPGETQPAFPWRGHITIDPAPGIVGSPDKTATAATQIGGFFGAAAPGHFSVAGTNVSYTGPSDWGYRRFVLHYAHLAAAAGGVDAFLVGTELRGLTTARSSATAYPAVDALRTLAADVRGILGSGTKLSYAADWTEYAVHRPEDGSGDVLFHLDPLWADANIDFVAIDSYAPLSDWRDGEDHLDREAGAPSIYDLDYLKGNVEGGEAYEWFYADDTARNAQNRTPIVDSAHGEHWIFRAKDLRGFWQNAHHDRPGGVRAATPTGWVPKSKPIWLTELGCPAIDKGANEPNVFYDPKSSDGGVPHFSTGRRDDLMQRRYLEAAIGYWEADAGNNPSSDVYAGRMIDSSRIFVWAWDARPFPDFPTRADAWRDAPLWAFGHWLNGRAAELPLADLVRALTGAVEGVPIETVGLSSLVEGYVLDRIMSPRDAIEPLMLAFRFDAVEAGGLVRFVPRGSAPELTLSPADLCESAPGAATTYLIARAQETDLPAAAKLTFIESLSEYRQAAVESRRTTRASDRIAKAELPIVMEQATAQGIADTWLMETWTGRETAEFRLPPSRLALEQGDVVTLALPSRTLDLQIERIADAGARAIEAKATDRSLAEGVAGPGRGLAAAPPPFYGAPLMTFLDLPLLSGEENPAAPHVAAYAKPWPGAVAVYRAGADAVYAFNTQLPLTATVGETITDFYAGATGRWERGNAVWVRLYDGALSSASEELVLDGANLIAIENADGGFEVLQFLTAELVDVKTYKLTTFLRGQGGTGHEMRNPVAAGARVVLLDAAVRQVSMTLDERNRPFNWRSGPIALPIGDPAFAVQTRAFAGIGLRPLSPVHLRAKRPIAAGDITITWIRRTREGGDAWDGADVPLGEDTESYVVEILSGGLVVRTLTSTSESVSYSAAAQIIDFGSSTFSALAIRVAQVSAVFGRGIAAEATLYL
ncbi:MAG: hypothetical protein GC199_06950 [Alphaproteobacteria bacterium]|nr:hypothetical protein [Alphaproteobacteria bacterium]